MKYLPTLAVVLSVFFLTSCNPKTTESSERTSHAKEVVALDGLHKAYFASGCFWCVEAIFEEVKGVKEVISGYSGGSKNTATYKQVSAGITKHTEAVEIHYDSSEVDYPTLVRVFYGSHDPTTANRQGPDRGTQYRSAIFFENKTEEQEVRRQIAALESSGEYAKGSIVTEVVPLEAFYAAEDYHQDYERNHPENPYIQGVSIPRLKRFQKKFPELLKH